MSTSFRKPRGSASAPISRSYEYQQKYPEDAYGEETAPDARVWKTYLDESDLHDMDKIEGWRDTLDVLLVFIGLFSAIVTTFVVQTSQTLQPDYAQLTALLAFEMVSLQRAINNGSSIMSVPSTSFNVDPGFSPSPLDSWVNGLWFTSLTIALSTALVTVLTKQWLFHYMSSTSGSARDRCRIRQFRYDGLLEWRVPLIIDLLPLALHVSLALFLAGLVLFIFPVHRVIAGIVCSIASVAYILYGISVLLPLRFPQCPYKSPLAVYMSLGRANILTFADLVSAWASKTWHRGKVGWQYQAARFSCLYHSRQPPPPPPLPAWLDPALSRVKEDHSFQSAERAAVSQNCSQIDVDAIIWVYSISSNSNVRNVALQSLGGLHPSPANMDAATSVVRSSIDSALRSCLRAGKGCIPGREPEFERLSRTSLLSPTLSHNLGSFGDLEDTERDGLTVSLKMLFAIIRFDSPNQLISFLGMCMPSSPRFDLHLPLFVWERCLSCLLRHKIYSDHHNSSPVLVHGLFQALMNTGRYRSAHDWPASVDDEPHTTTFVEAVRMSKQLHELAKAVLLHIVKPSRAIKYDHDVIESTVQTWVLDRWSRIPRSDEASQHLAPLLLSTIRAMRLIVRDDVLHRTTILQQARQLIFSDFVLDERLVTWATLTAVAEVFSSFTLPIRLVPVHRLLELLTLRSSTSSLEFDEFYLNFLNVIRALIQQHILTSMELIITEIIDTGTLSLLLLVSPFNWAASTSVLFQTIVDITLELDITKPWAHAWIDHIHLLNNLLPLCKGLLRDDVLGRRDHGHSLRPSPPIYYLLRLSAIRPQSAAWIPCFRSLIDLRQDEQYMAAIVSRPENLQEFYLLLRYLKAALPVDLSASEFDLPEFAAGQPISVEARILHVDPLPPSSSSSSSQTGTEEGSSSRHIQPLAPPPQLEILPSLLSVSPV